MKIVNTHTTAGITGIKLFCLNTQLKCKNKPKLTIAPRTEKMHNAAQKGNLFKRIGGKE